MARKALTHWEPLFGKALDVIDAARAAIGHDFQWTFGGGTALMMMYNHRFSRDIDIFVGDPQILGHLTPRLSPAAESLTDQYDESGEWVKLRLPEGEIDFIGTGWLTPSPSTAVTILGRAVQVETPAEIVAKKVHHRADTFKARGLFDLATVYEHDRKSLHSIQPILAGRRNALLDRVKRHRKALEEEYESLDLFDTRRSLADCIRALELVLK
ncbi:MAG: nucleotidyl transferase AbiEii/AbiGii toxin family protein [Usitatibacter sp.]